MKRDFYYLNTDVKAAALPAGCKRGVTLIELMVAALIMIVVTSAALSLFRVAATHEKRQQEVITQTQNLRAALYAVSRDIRMAGNGLPMLGARYIHIYVDPSLANKDIQRESRGWFTYAKTGTGENPHGIWPVFGTNSNTDRTKSDSLTIFRAELESTFPLGRLDQPFTPGTSDKLVLKSSDKKVIYDEHFTNGEMLGIASGTTAVIVQGSVTNAKKGDEVTSFGLGTRFKPAENLPDGFTFPAGSFVYNLRDVTFVTYYVDTTNHRLMADYHDATVVDEDADDANKKHLVTVADNIEDFQVAYFFFPPGGGELVQDADINWDLLDAGNVVQAVQLAMVSRSRNASLLNPNGEAVEIMGHKVQDEKGFSRQVLSEVITLRNFVSNL